MLQGMRLRTAPWEVVKHLLEQSLVSLASQDPVLQEIFIVAIASGAQTEHLPMHPPAVGVCPNWAHPLVTVIASAYFGNNFMREFA